MPDDEYGVFSTSDCKRIWKAVGAFERSDSLLLPSPRDFIGQTPIYYRNDSGETIPPFSIIQLTDTIDDEGKTYYIAKKPIVTSDALTDRFAFSGPNEVPSDGFGVAQEGPIYRVAKSPSLTLVGGMRLGPEHNAWTAAKGIMFSYLGDDLIDDDVLRVDRNESMLLGIATSGVTARVSTTLGSGTVAIKHLSVSGANRVISDSGYTVTAYNLASDAVASGAYVLLGRIGPFPVVIWEECIQP
jgi:hypothetical protein